MKDTISYFDSYSGQRYYHVVAYESNNNLYTLQSFWKDCGILKKENIISHDLENFVIEQGKLVTDIKYHFGEEGFSLNDDDKAPYKYDLFAVRLKKQNLLIFGFPFKNIAREKLQKIIGQKKILEKGNFIKTDLNKLIKHSNKQTQFSNDSFITHFSGVELVLTAETNISSVNLDGDMPLESNLYRNVFLDKVENNECKLEKCSLKCETIEHKSNSIPKTKSNIHLDLFGNYKFYVHQSGKNIFTIPFLFEMLSKLKCLKTTLINPILRLENE